MDKRIIAFLAASAFATTAGAAGMDKAEKGAMGEGGAQFTTLDADGDGKISKEEAQGTLKEKWSKADANSDGSVDQSEFSAFEAEYSSDTGKSQEGGTPPE